jgi:hypothetical protein
MPAPLAYPGLQGARIRPQQSSMAQVLGRLNTARLGLRDAVLAPLELDTANAMRKFNDVQGGAAVSGEADATIHRENSRAITELLGMLLPPNAAALGADALGGVNETLSGYGAAAAGRPFESKTGWDWNDVVANRQGQQAALNRGAGAAPLAWGMPNSPAPELLQMLDVLAGRIRMRN